MSRHTQQTHFGRLSRIRDELLMVRYVDGSERMRVSGRGEKPDKHREDRDDLYRSCSTRPAGDV